MNNNTFQNLRCKLCYVLIACAISQTSFAKNHVSDDKNEVSKVTVSKSLPTFSLGRKTSLNIILQPNQAILSWSAIDLEDGKYLIYRSNDNVNFEKIGEKTIVGNAKEPSLYIFHDEELTKGLNSYKLVKQDNLGGAREIAIKGVFLDKREPNAFSNNPIPRINRI
ncbi:hypothetical protein [Pedobacter ureilyticus]|uniref:Glycosyl hydrolase family 32 N-terminal domain-containing protein n=1 Tax=Pedobacter ureilyticus TaxID=1393051 RepID=A0ABW9JE86_9SPHI|nr:hypothetical protein [Pedobacter helvus]